MLARGTLRGASQRRPHGGYTLTELLVVVLILVILMAIALPAVKRSSEDARIREASRQLHAFFTMAKARAASSGRVAGVELVVQRGANNSPFATQFYLCESPALYGGSTTASTAHWDSASGRLVFRDSGGNDESSYLTNLIQDLSNPRDMPFVIRFGFRGEWYLARWDQSGSRYTLTGGWTIAPPSQPAPFQIRRLAERVGNPSELPAGACVDLYYSGTGAASGVTAGHEFGLLTSRLQILFSPAGHVEGFIGDTSIVPATSALFLLVGQTIKVGNRGRDAADPRNDSNLAEGTNLWLSVGRQTGAVATTENVITASRDRVPMPNTQAEFLADLRTARQFAAVHEQMKGQ